MRVRMLKNVLWGLNALLTLAILASVALFLLKSREAKADLSKNLDDIAREVQAKNRKAPVHQTQPFTDYAAVKDLILRDNPPIVEFNGPDAGPPRVTPLDSLVVARAIAGTTVVFEYIGKKDPVIQGLPLQKIIEIGQDIADINPKATVSAVDESPEHEGVKVQYDGKEVVLPIKRDLDAMTRAVASAARGQKPKNARPGLNPVIAGEDEDDFPGPLGQVPVTGRTPLSEEELKDTREIKPGVWQIGTEERDRIRDNARNLLEEAEVSASYNEKLKKYDGMKIDHLPADSLLGQRGLQEGDVIKSVNGRPINSKTELINYVKDNQNQLQTVSVVIERKGKNITLTYNIPQ